VTSARAYPRPPPTSSRRSHEWSRADPGVLGGPLELKQMY